MPQSPTPHRADRVVHKHLRTLLGALSLPGAFMATLPAHAALDPGVRAPAFSLEAALDGKPFRFDLQQALSRGPVVLYFFPKAFTSGCTVEAHEFAEATPRFERFSASVIGVSADGPEAIRRFSTEACRDRFPVASDADAVTIRKYDAANASRPGIADRISYVIGRDGRIAHVFSGTDPVAHVRNALAAVENLQARDGASPR